MATEELTFQSYPSVNYKSQDPVENLRVRVTVTEIAGPRVVAKRRENEAKGKRFTTSQVFSWQSKASKLIFGGNYLYFA